MSRIVTGEIKAQIAWVFVHIEENFRADNRGSSTYSRALSSEDVNAVWYGERYLVGGGPDWNADFNPDYGGDNLNVNFDLRTLIRRFFNKPVTEVLAFSNIKGFIVKNIGEEDLEFTLPFEEWDGATILRPSGTQLIACEAGWVVDDTHRIVTMQSIEPVQFKIGIIGSES